MKTFFPLFISLFFLSGCTVRPQTIIPINVAPLSEEKATVIFYYKKCCKRVFRVFIDKQSVGVVTVKRPFKIEVEPGDHELYAQIALYIRRVTSKKLEKGKSYFMELSIDKGYFPVMPSSVRIEERNKIDNYVMEF